MTVAAELAKRHQRIEYILAIEGIGWLIGDNPANGFYAGSRVWTTADLDGTLASDISATVHRGLTVSGSISESIDPIKIEYSIGGLTFDVVDHDGWWLANFTPRLTDETEQLSAALGYAGTVVTIDDGSGFDEGDIVWIGHRELVKLGTKANTSGTEYTFTGSTRGYFGTPRGSSVRTPDYGANFAWQVTTPVSTIARFWTWRNVALYAHVPGESASNLSLVWVGRLSGVRVIDAGNAYRLDCSGDWAPRQSTIEMRDWEVSRSSASMSSRAGIYTSVFDTDEVTNLQASSERWSAKIALELNAINDENYERRAGAYAMASWYHYRWEPGGTDGMALAWGGNTSSVQAYERDDFPGGGFSNYKIVMAALGVVDSGSILFGLYRFDGDIGHPWAEITSMLSQKNVAYLDADYLTGGSLVLESGHIRKPPGGTKVRFLLDSWPDSYDFNRFQIQRQIPTHPIDYALMFMLSTDNEYEVFDAAASSTSSVIKTSGLVSGLYDGFALFAVEDDNKFYARTITSNTTTDITLEDAFPSSPTVGKEYQIRNSVYDVLPLGWGMGIQNSKIDVDSFLNVKEQIPTAKIDKFILGMDAKIDLWEFVQENLLKPFGVLTYFDFDTRKISARLIGDIPQDGIITDYPTIDTDDIYRVGDIDFSEHEPIGTVTLELRQSLNGVIRSVMFDFYDGTAALPRELDYPASMSGGTVKAVIRADEYQYFLGEERTSGVTIKAPLNSIASMDHLTIRAKALLARHALQLGVIDLDVDFALKDDLIVGAPLVISSLPQAADQNLGVRGFTHVLGRVIARELSPDSPTTMRVSVELHESTTYGKIAPACRLASTYNGSDGTSHWFVVNPTAYVSESGDNDMHKFAVGDRIIVRKKTGEPYTGTTATSIYTIRSFGANDSATPTGASTNIIRVTTAIGGTPGADDYLTLAPWSSSNTARMEEYAAYAGSDGTLEPSDAGRRYLG